MGMEIERKFLLSNDNWRTLGIPIHYAQGYLVADGERTVRVRIAGTEGFLTIKGKSKGFSRKEFEYPIPVDEATEMLQMCTCLLYTSDAADEEDSVDLGGRRIIKKKKKKNKKKRE